MEMYHVLNRGVDKKDVVIDDSDRNRFVHSLFVFNDSNHLNENHPKRNVVLSATERNPLVYIHAWCLMNNHYHLLLSPVNDDVKNISQFMKKLNMGYARYFNERHDRSGYLWQGKYKKILIERNAQFLYIPYYIHLNPLDYSLKEWRKGQLTAMEGVVNILQNYRWSSYLDYSGIKNFPSVIYKTVLSGELGDKGKQLVEIKNIVSRIGHNQGANQLEK